MRGLGIRLVYLRLFEVSADLPIVGGWRAELLEAQASAISGVADAMAKSFAANSLGALTVALGIHDRQASLTQIEMPNIGRQIAEPIGEYQAGIGLRIANQLAALIRPIALAATSGVLTTIRRHERRYEQALWKMGWWVPGNVSVPFFWRVGELATEGRKLEVRRGNGEPRPSAPRPRDDRRVARARPIQEPASLPTRRAPRPPPWSISRQHPHAAAAH